MKVKITLIRSISLLLLVLLGSCVFFSCDSESQKTPDREGTGSTDDESVSSAPSETSDMTEATDATDAPTEEAATDAPDEEDATDAPPENTYESAPNLVMANDQLSGRLVIFDLDQYSLGKTLDELEVWSVDTGHAAGLKYREDTVFGDVIIVAGTVSAMYAYPSGEILWSTDEPGKNPHSIEILPSGNIVIASSTDSKLRFFNTSALKSGGEVTYTDYTLEDAHGVLWDPEYEILWAIGNVSLKAYRLRGSGENENMVSTSSWGTALPEGFRGGHDLSADYTNTRYLYLSLGYRIVRFDKETKELQTLSEKSADSVKGFSNNPSGNLFATGACGGEGLFWDDEWFNSWCTETINFCLRNDDGTYEKIAIKSEKSAFYKARAFCGDYQ